MKKIKEKSISQEHENMEEADYCETECVKPKAPQMLSDLGQI